jgi:hypothetical protein
MEKYYQMDEIIDSFKTQFGCILKYERISIKLGNIHAFFIEIEESCLKNSWKEMRNFIAIKFQNVLSSEFERWNTYLLYLVKNSLSTDLKYQIENDTFSSRKIVIEGKSDIAKIIEEHILNSDIEINSTIKNDLNFIPNPIIFENIVDIEVKLRVTDVIKEAHSQILNRIKEESHEI